MAISLKYGLGRSVPLDVPPERLQAHFAGPKPIASLEEELRRVLASPYEFPPFERACFPGDHICIVLDRHTPRGATLVAGLWERLAAAEVTPEDVVILQPAALDGITLTDPRCELPGDIQQRIGWVKHDPTVEEDLGYVASTATGVRVYLSRLASEADVVVTVGEIAFDPVLGFRGTGSACYPGLSNPEAIGKSHGEGHTELRPEDERPLRQTIDEVTWLLGSLFTVQVLSSANGDVTDVFAGSVDPVFKLGKRRLGKRWSVATQRRAELVVVGIEADAAGHGWRQLGRALDSARKLVTNGGKIVIASEIRGQCTDAFDLLRSAESPRDALRLLRDAAPVDLVPAIQIARAADWANVHLLSNLDPEMVEDLSMFPLLNEKSLLSAIEGQDECLIISGGQHVFASVEPE